MFRVMAKMLNKYQMSQLIIKKTSALYLKNYNFGFYF